LGLLDGSGSRDADPPQILGLKPKAAAPHANGIGLDEELRNPREKQPP
jgi:hypothetical protein